MLDRRQFLSKTSRAAALFALPAERHFQKIAALGPRSDEQFWHEIRAAFSVSPAIINLNNGGVSPAPRIVQEAQEHFSRLSNDGPSHFMWRILDQGREPLRQSLAEITGAEADEIAMVRNASEALEAVIFGLPLERGDEVVVTRLDYPNMMNAWLQREKRDGIVLKWVDLPVMSENSDAITALYEAAFSPRTKLVHITHAINWTGQILPCRRIADAAKRRGIEVLIDGAHSLFSKNYRIDELGGDYFGASLHKWLCGPIGTGLLWIKKEKIGKIWPHFAADEKQKDDIRKFENLGTRPFSIEQALGKAVDFHRLIGAERRAERLFFLKNYWAERAVAIPKVKILTSLNPEFSGPIAVVAIDGKTPAEVGNFLFDKHKIHTTGIDWRDVQGVRVTPNVYTMTWELDRLLEGLKKCAAG